MDEQDIKELLQGERKRRFPLGSRCPNESLLTAYVDRGLEAGERVSLESHLADCNFCLGQVAFLVHSDRWVDPVDVPPQLLARAQQTVLNPRRTAPFSGWTWATVAAVAACLLIAFTIVITLRLRRSGAQASANQSGIAQQDPGQRPAAVSQSTAAPRNPEVIASANTPAEARSKVPRPEPSAPLVRKAEPDKSAPTVTFPQEGAVVRREKLEFRWQAVPDVLFYDFSIMTAAGDPVISRQTDQTRLELSPDVQLISNAKYFVSVRAHLREGKTARSGVVSFRVAE